VRTSTRPYTSSYTSSWNRADIGDRNAFIHSVMTVAGLSAYLLHIPYHGRTIPSHTPNPKIPLITARFLLSSSDFPKRHPAAHMSPPTTACLSRASPVRPGSSRRKEANCFTHTSFVHEQVFLLPPDRVSASSTPRTPPSVSFTPLYGEKNGCGHQDCA